MLAVLTMTVANLIAGRQESVKRMLAYSSIAHAGYMLVGVVALMRDERTRAGQRALLPARVHGLDGRRVRRADPVRQPRRARRSATKTSSGLGRRHPAAALAFALFLLSLAGIPPTAGFFGKWFVFRAAIDGGLYWLAIVAFVNSVIGAYYYLRVLVYMYMREPAAGAPVAVPMQSAYVNAALLLSAVLVIALGLAPTRFLYAALNAATFGAG